MMDKVYTMLPASLTRVSGRSEQRIRVIGIQHRTRDFHYETSKDHESGGGEACRGEPKSQYQ